MITLVNIKSYTDSRHSLLGMHAFFMGAGNLGNPVLNSCSDGEFYDPYNKVCVPYVNSHVHRAPYSIPPPSDITQEILSYTALPAGIAIIDGVASGLLWTAPAQCLSHSNGFLTGDLVETYLSFNKVYSFKPAGILTYLEYDTVRYNNRENLLASNPDLTPAEAFESSFSSYAYPLSSTSNDPLFQHEAWVGVCQYFSQILSVRLYLQLKRLEDTKYLPSILLPTYSSTSPYFNYPLLQGTYQSFLNEALDNEAKALQKAQLIISNRHIPDPDQVPLPNSGLFDNLTTVYDPSSNTTIGIDTFYARYGKTAVFYAGRWLTLEQYALVFENFSKSYSYGNALGNGVELGMDEPLPVLLTPPEGASDIPKIPNLPASPPPPIPALPTYQPDIDLRNFATITSISSYLDHTVLPLPPAPKTFTQVANFADFNWSASGWVDNSGTYYLWCDPFDITSHHIHYTGIVVNGDPSTKVILPQEAFRGNSEPWSSRLALQIPLRAIAGVNLTLLGAYAPASDEISLNAFKAVSVSEVRVITPTVDELPLGVIDATIGTGEYSLKVSFETNASVTHGVKGELVLLYSDANGVIYSKSVTIPDITKYTSWGLVEAFTVPLEKASFHIGLSDTPFVVPMTLSTYDALFTSASFEHLIGTTKELYLGIKLPQVPRFDYACDLSFPVLEIWDTNGNYQTALTIKSSLFMQYGVTLCRLYTFSIPSSITQVVSNTLTYTARVRFVSNSTDLALPLSPTLFSGVKFSLIKDASVIFEAPYDNQLPLHLDAIITKRFDTTKLRAYTIVNTTDVLLDTPIVSTSALTSVTVSKTFKIMGMDFRSPVKITKIGFIRPSSGFVAAQATAILPDYVVSGEVSATNIGVTESLKVINREVSPLGLLDSDRYLSFTTTFKTVLKGSTALNAKRMLTIKVYGTSADNSVESVLLTFSINHTVL